MTSTQTDTQALTPEKMYDMVMSRIEPELMTENLQILDDIYAEETEAAKQQRLARYALAFEKFDVEYERFVNGLKMYYMDIRKKAESLKRTTLEKNDKDDTSAIEASILQS